MLNYIKSAEEDDAILKSVLVLEGTAVSCRQCLTLLTNGLSTLEGIESVSADLQTDTVTIDYDSNTLDEAAIRAKVRSIGFAKERLYCIC